MFVDGVSGCSDMFPFWFQISFFVEVGETKLVGSKLLVPLGEASFVVMVTVVTTLLMLRNTTDTKLETGSERPSEVLLTVFHLCRLPALTSNCH